MRKIKRFWILVVSIGVFLIILTNCEKESNPVSVSDINGNVYKIDTIGEQIWMLENLKTTKYKNGDPIPNVTDAHQWVHLTSGAYCDYNNDVNNGITYGHLYNTYVIHDKRGVCPAGWHVPRDSDWRKLTHYLGGDSLAGGKLKRSWNTALAKS